MSELRKKGSHIQHIWTDNTVFLVLYPILYFLLVFHKGPKDMLPLQGTSGETFSSTSIDTNFCVRMVSNEATMMPAEAHLAWLLWYLQGLKHEQARFLRAQLYTVQ